MELRDDEIRTAITRTFHCRETYDTYAFCLFIDGLDEYEETLQDDYKVLIRTLKEWVHLSKGGIKICVSSREYNVFENAFLPEKRIRLQDVTRVDMERYARDMLEDLDNEEQKSRLVSAIVTRSDGIFLWVALVVRVFREYIEDDQHFAAFDEVLRSLPDELEALFAYLLDTMRRPMRKKTYQIFALMDYMKMQYDQQLFLLPCIFLQDYERNTNFAVGSMIEYLHQDMDALEVVAHKRLNGYCKGLVVVKQTEFMGKCIAFTHRLITEFLDKDTTKQTMQSHLFGFDLPHVVPQLLLAHLRCVKKASNHNFWARFASKLITDEFEPCKPFTYLSCLEAAIIDKIGRPGTLEMDGKKPLNQQIVVINRLARHYLENNGSVGNFFLVSPFYLSAFFGKLDYVMWKIELDPRLVREETKRDFLYRCLSHRLNDDQARARFDMMMDKRAVRDRPQSEVENCWGKAGCIEDHSPD